jgi:hypothetical protein
MKYLLAGTAGLSFGVFLVATNSVAQGTTFKGEITDANLKCVQMTPKLDETHRTACVLNEAHFVQPGSKYVLYNEATKTTYQLDDQNQAQTYVAAKVEVTGTLDAATKTIKVKDIKVDPAAYKTANP